MGDRFDWLREKGIAVEEGLNYTGGEDRYATALQRYFRGYEANRAEVESTLAAGDIEGYAIKVHALKSNSRMIGAMDLGSEFETLEMAAKQGDTATINEKTAPTLEHYREIMELLRPIGEGETLRAAGEISGEEAKETVEKLYAALDEFDDDLSRELAEKLKGYPFRITQKGKLNEAISLIEDFQYDEAVELIREIEPTIELP